MSRLYRDTAFEPVAEIGEYLGLLTSEGIVSKRGGEPVFHQIEFIEPVPELIIQGPTALGAGSSSEISATQTQNLEMPTNELLQVRFVIGTNGGSLTDGAHPRVTWAQLRAVNRGVTSRAQGRWSASSQGTVPRLDTPAGTAFDPMNLDTQLPYWRNHLTEHFIFEGDTPVYTVTNDGGTAVAAGVRIDLMFYGYRYVLSEVRPGPDWTMHSIYGKQVRGPRNFTRVPIAGRGR